MDAAWEAALAEIARRFRAAPGRAFLVGGAARDLLLGHPPRDVDLLIEVAAEGEASCLQALRDLSGMQPVVFDRRPPATYRVVLGGVVVDVSFCPPGGVEQALRRRDFTVNALALPLPSAADRLVSGGAALMAGGDLVDPFGGLEALSHRTLSPVTDASLDEDPLRMLRAVRLAATISGLAISPDLEDRIRSRSERIRESAAERVRAEMDLILGSRRAGAALRRMDALGLLSPLLPELDPLRGLAQPSRHHDHDAFEHTLRAVEQADLLAAEGCAPAGIGPLAGEEAVVLKWAALLHDAGKAASASIDEDGVPHFYGHETASAALAEEALRRLRVPARTAETVVALISLHLRIGALAAAQAGERPRRRLARAAGARLGLLALLALADRRASGGEDAAAREAALLDTARRLLEAGREALAAARRPALLDGREIMAIMNLRPGPRVGSIARWIERLRADGRLATREQAEALLRSLPPPKIRD